MSAPNPEEIVAEVLYSQESSGDFTKYGQGGYPYTDCDALAAHVISRLAQAGHTIVPAALLRDLVDPDDCWFDHDGGCQAHGHFPSDGDRAWVCPVEAAKNILKAGTVDVEIVDEVVDDAR
ncbi:hypothetical protein [Rhodococcoides fascians]|uniref:hypothetical protein n=1 Tax=Rhodococcoides fascians TaxID=1828 RepID=UPI00050C6248|nr:hypothetical protein [Rhodococcus fascians]